MTGKEELLAMAKTVKEELREAAVRLDEARRNLTLLTRMIKEPATMNYWQDNAHD